jgi:hypothetical protein
LSHSNPHTPETLREKNSSQPRIGSSTPSKQKAITTRPAIFSPTHPPTHPLILATMRRPAHYTMLALSHSPTHPLTHPLILATTRRPAHYTMLALSLTHLPTHSPEPLQVGHSPPPHSTSEAVRLPGWTSSPHWPPTQHLRQHLQHCRTLLSHIIVAQHCRTSSPQTQHLLQHLQHCRTALSHVITSNTASAVAPAALPHRIVAQHCRTALSHSIVAQHCRAALPHSIVTQHAS